MGPRVFTRGNLRSSPLPSKQPYRFNGATRLHAWKLVFGDVMVCEVARFNGATRLHAWKRDLYCSHCAPPFGLQWGHASSRVETRQTFSIERRYAGFNGATRLHAWKPLFSSQRFYDLLGLQWGHASSRVETRPPPVDGIRGDLLQWGHASSRVETLPDAAASLLAARLQWGHASSRVETSLPF